MSGEELEHTSSLGRKTKADDDLNESAAKEQRPNGSPSSNRKLIQSSYAEDAAATDRLAYRFLSGEIYLPLIPLAPLRRRTETLSRG